MKQGVDYIGVAVGAMMFNDKGELFITKRSQNCKNERGHWEIPGGSVQFGETLEDAVKREVKEEYGVDVEIVKQYPASDHIIPADKQHWAPTTFIVTIKSGQTPTIMEPDKCDAIGWFPLNNLPTPLSIITRIDIARYLDEKNNRIKKTMACPHCGRYDNRGISVDALVVRDNEILLIKRGVEPDKGKWGTPGGYVGWDESAEEAVVRELKEETGLVAESVEFLTVSSSPKRHPQQVITIAYRVKVGQSNPQKGDDADDVRWFPLDAVPKPLAFDHEHAIELLRKTR
jgi:mutator protein MutT